MASEFVKLQNTFSEPLKAYAEGETFNFAPRGLAGSIQPVTQEEADSLLEDYPQLAIVDPGTTALDRVVKVIQKEVWIANMTGNPDAPERVTGVSLASGKAEFLENEDPYSAKKPRDVIVQGVERKSTHTEKDGILLTYTDPGREERIPPYTRVKFRAHVATAFTALEMNMPQVQQGSIIISREPAEFEPDYNWSFAEKRLYLEMLPEGETIGSNVYPAGKFVLGESEEEIRERLANAPKRELARELHKAEEECWQRIVQRLFHPGIPLPSKKAYEKFSEKRLPASAKSDKPKKQAAAPSGDVADILNQL